MNSTAVGIASAVLSGLTVIFGGIFFCACMISGGKIPPEYARAVVYSSLAVGCIITAFFGSKNAAAKKLIFGICSALCLLLCLFFLALCWRGQSIQPISAAVISGICLLSASIGAFSGSALKTKRKK